MIQNKLQALEESGELKKHQQQITEQAQQRLRRPVPVKNLVTTQTPRSWLYDPSITVSQDMKDHKGRLFAAKGTKLNPLTMFSWGSPLLLLNGDDPAQIAWAKRQLKYSKWVLTQGSPLELEEQEHRAIYFDQGGRLSRKFGLQQIPCRITQQGKKLLIEEVSPHEH